MVSSTCLVNSARVSCCVPAASFATFLATSLSKLNPAPMHVPKFRRCLFRQCYQVPEHLVHVPGIAQRGSTPLFWCELLKVDDQVLALGVNQCPGVGGHTLRGAPLVACTRQLPGFEGRYAACGIGFTTWSRVRFLLWR